MLYVTEMLHPVDIYKAAQQDAKNTTSPSRQSVIKYIKIKTKLLLH
jgi:hypothetical protein